MHWPAWPLSWVLTAEVANAVRAVVAAWGLGLALGKRPRIDSLRKLTLFLLIAVAAAPAVGAFIGAANVVFHGASTSFLEPFAAWFASNALAGLTMLPVMLSAFRYVGGDARWRPDRARILEAALLAGALALACVFAFLTGIGRVHVVLPLYGTLPVLIWAAVRFGTSGASAALTVVAGAAVWSIDRGTGPFLAPSPDANVFAVQMYILCTAAPVLCLAALASARENVVQLYRALLGSQQDHVAMLDADGVIIEANASWRRTSGLGDGYLACCEASARAGDDTARQIVAGLRSVLARERSRFELEYDVREGAAFEAYVLTFEPLERAEGGAVVTRRNVTARRVAQLEIQEHRNQLSHLARVSALGHLSGAIAHELRQPLTAILSNAEAGQRLLQRQPLDSSTIAAIFADIVGDDHRAAAVIDRMRALLRRGEVQSQSIEVKEIVDAVRAVARAELVARQIELSVELAPALPPVLGDRIQLQQVLLNLVLNACEAMKGTIAARRLWITAERDSDGGIHIAVRDSGAGIPSALLPDLFKPFVTTKEHGLGLGLSISQTIVLAHGGRLWADNHADGGAVLHCALPTRDTPARAGLAVRVAGRRD